MRAEEEQTNRAEEQRRKGVQRRIMEKARKMHAQVVSNKTGRSTESASKVINQPPKLSSKPTVPRKKSKVKRKPKPVATLSRQDAIRVRGTACPCTAWSPVPSPQLVLVSVSAGYL